MSRALPPILFFLSVSSVFAAGEAERVLLDQFAEISAKIAEPVRASCPEELPPPPEKVACEALSRHRFEDGNEGRDPTGRSLTPTKGEKPSPGPENADSREAKAATAALISVSDEKLKEMSADPAAREKWIAILANVGDDAEFAEICPKVFAAGECGKIAAYTADAALIRSRRNWQRKLEAKVPSPLTQEQVAFHLARAKSLVLDRIVDWPEPAKKLVDAYMGAVFAKRCDDAKSMRAYTAGYGEIAICDGILMHTSSLFELMDMLAHEVGHVVYAALGDVEYGGRGLPAPLRECLRSKESIGALPDHPRKKQLHARISAKLGGSKAVRNYVRVLYADQLEESFADYFSAELLPDLIPDDMSPAGFANGYGNLFGIHRGKRDPEDEVVDRTLAEIAKVPFYEEHPAIDDRLDRIYGVNPRIRSQIGCASLAHPKWKYCGSLEANFVPATKPAAAPPSPSGT